jgi:hypothetical protein
MKKIAFFKMLRALMVLFAIFELYVAYVSPTRKDTIIYVLFSLFCLTTFFMVKRKTEILKARQANILKHKQ